MLCSLVFFVLANLLGSCLCLSPNFVACQVQKPKGMSPLVGCPPETIFVSQDVNDKHARFHSVQDAVLSLPELSSATILIAEGEYNETINVTRKGPLTMLGQLPTSALDSINRPFANRSDVPLKQNLVKIWNNQFVHTGMDDATSAVLLVAPSFNASLIGAGPTGAPLQPLFGNTDFKAYNIDFENRAANFSISQALVTDISYANASFYGCSFASFQDTWYTGRNGSTYVVDSIIYGQTDYLFGFGTAWFQNVVLANRACGGGIVAWKGTNLTDAPGNRYGAYIADSSIIRSPDANATTVTAGKCFLGRPWNDLATTVYLRTFMDSTVQPVGWTPFDSARPVIMNTTFYAEYDSTGPGGNTSMRIPLEHILTKEQAKDFTIDKVFLEPPKWIDQTYLF
ncbi:pectin lyase-like protein [Pholiota conissans]|uniref:pectinesterase n=1 Tax=Pholiota conissans TaxID=109636 RepID=A0A9P5Z8F0_9AGAR|nr:pectin lyase-like protein [Pholiota conissans]